MRPENEARKLVRALDRIEEILLWPDERLYGLVESVSRWSPAQQIQHVLLSLERFAAAIQTLEQGTDTAIVTRGSTGFLGRVLLLTGWIPRGRGEAPDLVRPDVVPSRAGLKDAWRDAHGIWGARSGRADGLRAVSGSLSHPILGPFRALQWLRFARLHTEHHLAIIADIDRTKVAGEPEADPLSPIGEPT